MFVKVFYNEKEKKAKIKVENPEELLVLKMFIRKGDFVTADTVRSREIIRDGKKIKVGKEKIRVTIEVEKIEQKENTLKLLGKIIESSKEASGYHSILVSPGSEIIVQKNWKRWEIEKLRKFSRPAEKVLACIMDEREAWIYIIGDKIEEKARVYSPHTKFSDESLKGKFFSEIFDVIKEWDGKIVLAGPGFAKEEFKKFLEEKGIEKARIFVDSVSHVGSAGLSELLKRKTLEKIAKESRISKEAEVVEKFFEEIAKNGNVVYGESETIKALEIGAVETILVSTVLVEKYLHVLELAEKMHSKIFLISNSHPAGERFYHFCGIGAFLRFKI